MTESEEGHLNPIREDVGPGEKLCDMFSMLDALTGPRPRQLASTEIEPELAVSTVDTRDCGCETAIVADHVYPVERYENEQAALVGHAAWVAKLQGGLDTITKLGYGSCLLPIEVHLKRGAKHAQAVHPVHRAADDRKLDDRGSLPSGEPGAESSGRPGE